MYQSASSFGWYTICIVNAEMIIEQLNSSYRLLGKNCWELTEFLETLLEKLPSESFPVEQYITQPISDFWGVRSRSYSRGLFVQHGGCSMNAAAKAVFRTGQYFFTTKKKVFSTPDENFKTVIRVKCCPSLLPTCSAGCKKSSWNVTDRGFIWSPLKFQFFFLSFLPFWTLCIDSFPDGCVN